jgi:hypothetical protein
MPKGPQGQTRPADTVNVLSHREQFHQSRLVEHAIKGDVIAMLLMRVSIAALGVLP